MEWMAWTMPTATFFMWRGIRPYREEVERLEAAGL